MSLQYLHFNIFEMALMDMATTTGSLNNRLAVAYINCLYKLHWDRDLESIPNEYKNEFKLLQKILETDLSKTIEKERQTIRESYQANQIEVDEETIDMVSNGRTVIKRFHWRKAQKVALLMKSIYNGLGHALQDQYKR